MPNKPRTPINYEQTTGRVFRPASEVQAERDALEQGEVEPVESNQDDGTNERSNERTNGQMERRVIRHSFDIYHDQLMQLGEIQMYLYREAGKKPKLGQLVQDALDRYISAHGASAHDGDARQ